MDTATATTATQQSTTTTNPSHDPITPPPSSQSTTVQQHLQPSGYFNNYLHMNGVIPSIAQQANMQQQQAPTTE